MMKFILKTFLFMSISILLIDFVSNQFNLLNFGKLDGLIFRIISTCVSSAFFYYFISKSAKISLFFIGFSTGLLSYFLTFVFYFVLSEISYGDNRGFDVPLIADQIIASIIIVVFGVCFIYKK